jgi:UDP-N-acetyl-D-mannosaminuronic acid transferase (WecB/TagA/CpsF family)
LRYITPAIIFSTTNSIKLASLIDEVEIKQNLNGTDLIPKIIALAAKKKQKSFLLGQKMVLQSLLPKIF